MTFMSANSPPTDMLRDANKIPPVKRSRRRIPVGRGSFNYWRTGKGPLPPVPVVLRWRQRSRGILHWSSHPAPLLPPAHSRSCPTYYKKWERANLPIPDGKRRDVLLLAAKPRRSICHFRPPSPSPPSLFDLSKLTLRPLEPQEQR